MTGLASSGNVDEVVFDNLKMFRYRVLVEKEAAVSSVKVMVMSLQGLWTPFNE